MVSNGKRHPVDSPRTCEADLHPSKIIDSIDFRRVCFIYIWTDGLAIGCQKQYSLFVSAKNSLFFDLILKKTSVPKIQISNWNFFFLGGGRGTARLMHKNYLTKRLICRHTVIWDHSSKVTIELSLGVLKPLPKADFPPVLFTGLGARCWLAPDPGSPPHRGFFSPPQANPPPCF